MMKSLLLSVLLLLAAFLPLDAAAQTPAPAAPPAAQAVPAITPAQAQQAIEILQDPQKREQLIAVLKAIAAASPSVTPAPAAPAAEKPAPITLKPDSLGAQLLVTLSRWSARLAGEAAGTVQAMTNLPMLWRWLEGQAIDPAATRSVLFAAGWLALVVAAALAVEFAAGWALRRPRNALTPSLPRGDGENVRLLRLLPVALVRLLFDLVPVAAFAATGNLLAATIAVLHDRTRLAVFAIVNAYAICRAVMCVARMLVSPAEPRLRLWRLDDESAKFVVRWLRRLVVVAVFGDTLVGVALLLGLDQAAHDGLQRLIALVLAVMLIVVVIRSRGNVAAYIRAPQHGPIARWRIWLAEAWPYLAVDHRRQRLDRRRRAGRAADWPRTIFRA